MISLDEFRQLAKEYSVIPIVESVFSGTETPVTIFEKLAADKPGSFLLESAEQGVWSRYSFIGVENVGLLLGSADKLSWHTNQTRNQVPGLNVALDSLSGLEALTLIQSAWKAAPSDSLPPLVSGIVGLLGWDTIHQIEKLSRRKPKSYKLPDLAMALIQDMVVLDHLDSSLKIISNAYVEDSLDLDDLYEQAIERIQAMKIKLLQLSQPYLGSIQLDAVAQYKRLMSDSEFTEMVELGKKHVVAGDVFQVVLSQRFEIENQASALDVYRMLRAINPSPYMYLLNFFDEDGVFAVVGSSPEALVRVQSRKAILHPIAGSRPRGATAEIDSQLGQELISDAKEKAEHLMLVDLARNDLLKVCNSDSVGVTEFMTVERYSHIMHLVSTVEGTLRDGMSAVDVLRATFPAGTLSGAPKPKALEIIEYLEPLNRGLFGGVVGYFDFAGNADLAIAIRTAVLRDGLGFVQAGAGIVLDSDPVSENVETINKASAPLRAIQAANHIERFQL